MKYGMQVLMKTLIITCTLVGLFVSSSLASTISGLVNFGFSFSDTGNTFARTGGTFPVSPPNYNGRFTNGLVWVEHLADYLGVPVPTASSTGDSNYAHGNAETGTETLNGVPGIRKQVSDYLSSLGSTSVDPDLLFVVHGGAPDFNHGQTDPSIPVDNLSLAIQELVAQGSRQFLVPNIPPLGQLPVNLGTQREMTLDNLASSFNTMLAAELDRLETDQGITIFRLDFFSFYQERLANPASFGLSNVTQPAWDWGSGSIVTNPQEYMFWDRIHPTAGVHQNLGNQAFKAVTSNLPLSSPNSLRITP